MKESAPHFKGSRIVLRTVLALAVVVAVSVFGWIAGSWFKNREIVLADGSILRVEGFTFGTLHTMALEPPLWTWFKQRVPDRWRRFTGQPSTPRRVAEAEGASMMWLSRLDATRTRYLPMADIRVQSVMENGEIFDVAGSMGFTPGEPLDTALKLGVVDWRRDTLRFRVNQGRSVREISLPNPRRGERFPDWQPGPLPATNVREGFEFVLRGIVRHGTDDFPFWIPQWEVNRDGQSMNHCFSSHCSFRDPTGNRGWTGLPMSEPVWQLVLTATPADAFPFPKERLFSVGRCVVPGPGQFQVVKPRDDWKANGLVTVVVAGPGGFVFRDGTNVLAGKPGEVSPGNSWQASPRPTAGEPGWSYSSESQQTTLNVILHGPEEPGDAVPATYLIRKHCQELVLRARRRDGTFVRSGGSAGSLSSDGRYRCSYEDFQLFEAQAGQELDLELVVVPRWTMEWKVARPVGR